MADEIDEIVEFGLAETRRNRMRPDQIDFANHLLSSWRHREMFSGDAITVGQNFHIPIVRRALKIACERRP